MAFLRDALGQMWPDPDDDRPLLDLLLEEEDDRRRREDRIREHGPAGLATTFAGTASELAARESGGSRRPDRYPKSGRGARRAGVIAW